MSKRPNFQNPSMWNPAFDMLGTLENYSQCDESWTIWWNYLGNARIFRFGSRFALTVTFRGSSWNKCWYDSFDLAALSAQLYVEGQWARRRAWARKYYYDENVRPKRKKKFADEVRLAA